MNISKEIKSLYIIKSIFSYLEAKKKLCLSKCNKFLQKIFRITIEDYKNKSSILKIGERNGYGKEYLKDTNILIFEGKYLNNKKNGIGKEYEEYKLKFKGNYVNGKRNGKGKEYYDNGEIMYSGEYLNGRRHGKGEFYDRNGELLFVGEYLNGKLWNGKGCNTMECEIKDGKGKVKTYHYKDVKILKFEGEYINGKLNGPYKEYNHEGKLIYEGRYLKGKKNGIIKEYNNFGQLKYEINCVNGERREFVEYIFDNKVKLKRKKNKK